MRRVFIIFILMLMPLQASWAVTAAYYAFSEEVASAQAFSYQADEHTASTNDTATNDGTPSDSGNTPDLPHSDNCHHCSIAGLLNDAPPVFHHPPNEAPRWTIASDNSTALAPRIERPNWIRLA